MIQLASALPVTLAAPGAPAPSLQGAASNFALALATLMPPPALGKLAIDSAAVAVANGQALAVPGKDLPDGDAEPALVADEAEDDVPVAADPAFAWFAPLLPAPMDEAPAPEAIVLLAKADASAPQAAGCDGAAPFSAAESGGPVLDRKSVV